MSVSSSLVHIGNLPVEANESLLFELFSPFGSIIGIRILPDPKTNLSRGRAFIEFQSADDSTEAIDNLDNSEWFGKIIVCDRKMTKKEKNSDLSDHYGISKNENANDLGNKQDNNNNNNNNSNENANVNNEEEFE